VGNAVRLAAAIITVDRGETNFLGATLRNLERSGWFSEPEVPPLWVVDSGSPAGYVEREAGGLAAQLHTDLPAERRSLNANASRALQLVTAEDVDFVLMMQDDIDVCADFAGSVRRWLADHHDDRWLLYSFGTTWPPIQEAALAGRASAPYPINQFFGTQCYALSMQRSRQLEEWFERSWPKLSSDAKGRNVYDDILLHRWAAETDHAATHFLASAPSLVQHVGDVSSIQNKPFTFPSWPGRQWSYEGRRAA
jgi:hypothetical protein